MFILDLETSCTSQSLARVMGMIFHALALIRIVVPILLILFSIKRITILIQNPDEKKEIKRIVSSFFATIVIFFLPVVVNAVMYMFGERYLFSSCWLLADMDGTSLNSTEYIHIDQTTPKKIYPNSSGYEAGEKDGNFASDLNSDYREKLVAAAKSQLGVPYYSMHYGPREGDGRGFGCAMFVSYCYNQVFFGGVSGQEPGLGGFYGSTYEYWGNVTNDGYDPHNKKFVEVSQEEALPGDVVAYTSGSNPYSSYSSCGHVALYIGNGRIIGSWGVGTSGPGVEEGSVESQAVGRDIHYLKYVGSD